MTVDLEQFFDTVWGENEGKVCLSFKPKGGELWNEFYAWPSQRTEVLSRSRAQSGKCDVYYTPALLRGESRSKLAFKSSGVAWVDYDSGLPDSFALAPSHLVETSPGHFHAYWKLDQVCSSINELEEVNRSLANSSGGDKCWDGTHLLRVPFTENVKRGAPVVIISGSEISYNLEQFPKVKALQLTVPLSSEGRVLNWLRRFSDFLMIRD